MTTTSRVGRGAAASAGAALVVVLLATPAAVAAPLSAVLTARPPLSTTVPYGSFWSLEFLSTESIAYDVVSVQVTGIPGVTDTIKGYGYSPSYYEHFFTLYPAVDGRLIDVGTYSVGANVSAANSGATIVRATTAVPQKLIIEPAELAATLRVTPDGADPQNTVVTMSLGGSWLTDVICCDYRSTSGRAMLDSIPAPPAGTWAMSITNAAGETIVEQQFEQVRGATPATVHLWTDAPIAESVTVDATFTATGDEGRNFVITQAAPVTFTTGSASRPEIVLPVVPEAPPAPVRTGVGLPVWALLLLAVIGLGAAVAGVVIGLRGRAAAAAPASVDDATPEDGAEAETAVDATEGWSLASSADLDDTASSTETVK